MSVHRSLVQLVMPPLSPPRLQRHHRILNGCSAAIPLWASARRGKMDAVNLVDGKVLTAVATAPDMKSSPFGTGYSNDGDNNKKLEFAGPIVDMSAGFTLFCAGHFYDSGSGSAVSAVVYQRVQGGAFSQSGIILNTEYDSGSLLYSAGTVAMFGVSSGFFGAEADSILTARRRPLILVGRRLPVTGACSVWINGVDRTTRSTSSTQDVNESNQTFAIGGSPSTTGGAPFNAGTINLGGAVDRAWTDEEIKWASHWPNFLSLFYAPPLARAPIVVSGGEAPAGPLFIGQRDLNGLGVGGPYFRNPIG